MASDESIGRILGEIDGLRKDVRGQVEAARLHSERAMNAAYDAKRVADEAHHSTEKLRDSILEHTRGLSLKVAAIETETKGQTGSIQTLLKAEDERRIREDERSKLEDTRWKSVSRWWPIGVGALGGLVTVAAYAFSHWKP